MRSFFDSMTPWRRNDGSLHVYVVPDQDTTEAILDAQGRLVGIDNLPLMPAPWLHFTVARLPQFDDVGNSSLTRLATALTEHLDGIEPFEMRLGGPVVHEVAVEAMGSPSAGWDRLVEAVRAAAASVTDEELPPPPYAPHVSLAYATGDVDSHEVELRLVGCPELGPFRVSEVRLVSVTVRPEQGTFDWVELASWPLGSS